MKALLVSKGHNLYGAFWNDQPPLHTELLAALFRWFGPSAALGRLLSIGFTTLLVAALYQITRLTSNRVGGLLAVILLASGTDTPRLAVSVLLELPAFAVGLAAVWCWIMGRRDPHWVWFLAGGVLFGTALQIKLTSVLLAPALVADWLIWIWRDQRCGGPGASPLPRMRGEANRVSRAPLVAAGAFVFAAALVFTLVSLRWYAAGTWTAFLESHFSSATRSAAAQAFAFGPASFKSDLALVVVGLAGGVLLLTRKGWSGVMPVALLAGLLLVHAFHRPFWDYYRLHFWIALAWLGGAGLAEEWRALKQTSGLGKGRSGGAALTRTVCAVGAASLVVFIPPKLRAEWRRLGEASSAGDNGRVRWLQQAAGHTRWLFTHDLIAAFWAGIPVPPELAVIPAKRRWSGQITPEEVRAAVNKYRPETIIIPDHWIEAFQLQDILHRRYRSVLVPGFGRVYQRAMPSAPSRGE